MQSLTTPGTTIAFRLPQQLLGHKDPIMILDIYIKTTPLKLISQPQEQLPQHCSCVSGDTACTITFAVTAGGNYYALITSTGNPVANTAVKIFYLEISYYLTSSGGPTNSSAVIYPLRKST